MYSTKTARRANNRRCVVKKQCNLPKFNQYNPGEKMYKRTRTLFIQIKQKVIGFLGECLHAEKWNGGFSYKEREDIVKKAHAPFPQKKAESPSRK